MPLNKHPVDVHELASLPYGHASKVLRSRGWWNDALGGDGELKTYRVRVTGSATAVCYVNVEATSEDLAIDAAIDEANKTSDWEVIDVDADDGEVIS